MCAFIFAELVRASRPVADDQHGRGTARVYIRTGYAASSAYYTSTGLPWYAVRAYYFNGPWSGNGYCYTGWADYAGRNGIACVPGTASRAATASCIIASRTGTSKKSPENIGRRVAAR